MNASHHPQRPTPELLERLYAVGVFPMVDPESGGIDWYQPDPRGILPLDAFRVSRSLARVVRAGRFEVRTDTVFERVIRACATDRGGDNLTWLDDRLIEAYIELHDLGKAHSIEAWRGGKLVGGLYGVHLGAAFFGESMFVRPDLDGRDASKVCLVHLVSLMLDAGFTLLDTQFRNPHLDRFGCVEISLASYMNRLADALGRDVRWPNTVGPVREERLRGWAKGAKGAKGLKG